MPVPKPRIGFPLFPMPDASGRMGWPDLESSIHDQIRVLLQTQPGEQLMRPGFGAGLQQFIGQPDSVTTHARIKETVQRALRRWETRIGVESIDLSPDDSRPGWVRVEIRFRIRRTGVPRQLGLTVALESA